MRRDLCFFFSRDLQSVFDAYYNAIVASYDKKPTATPYYKISFGLDFSFKYNMNGGSCTVHFLPLQQGTAVDIRYTIVQAFGARYEAHASKLNEDVYKYIGVSPTQCNIPVEEFVNYEKQDSKPKCPRCGIPTDKADAFCRGCGYVLKAGAVNSFCSACGAKIQPNSIFCTGCGKKI
jgi:hypothetical protein